MSYHNIVHISFNFALFQFSREFFDVSTLKDHTFILCVSGVNKMEYQYHILTTIFNYHRQHIISQFHLKQDIVKL